MVSDPIVGCKYWCIKADMESENVRIPWRGILAENLNGAYYLHRFDSKTGKIDEDTNATACVQKKDLYEHEQEALVQYIKMVLTEIEYNMVDLTEKIEKLRYQIDRVLE